VLQSISLGRQGPAAVKFLAVEHGFNTVVAMPRTRALSKQVEEWLKKLDIPQEGHGRHHGQLRLPGELRHGAVAGPGDHATVSGHQLPGMGGMGNGLGLRHG